MTTPQPTARRFWRALAALAFAGVLAGTAVSTATADTPPKPHATQPAPLDHGQAGGGATTFVTFGLQPANPVGATPRPFFNLTGAPGSIQRDNLRVSNFGAKPVTLAVYAADASTALDGGLAIGVRAQRPTEVGSWVRFPSLAKGSLTLPARSRLDLPFDLRVPPRAEPGDHAGALVVGLLTKSRDRNGALVDVESRVASRLYVRVTGALRPAITVTDVRGTYDGVASPFGEGTADLRMTVRNTGNVRLGVRATAGLRSVFGTEARVQSPRDTSEILPGDAVVVTLPATRALPLVRYEAALTATPTPGPQTAALGGPSGLPVRAATTFWAVPWALLAAVGLLLLLVLVGRLLRRTLRRGGGRHSAGRERDLGPMRPAGTAGHSANDDRVLVRLRPVLGRALVLAAVLCTVVAPAASATASAAGSDGTLTFSPAMGKDITPMYFVTSGPCPDGATNVRATMYGKGFPKSGQVVVSNSTSGISHTGPFVLPIQDTMANYAEKLNITLVGPYRIVLSCKVRLGERSFATMTGTVTFRTPHDYTAPAPTQAQLEAVVGQPGAQADGQLPPGAGAGSSPRTGALEGAPGSGKAGGEPSAAPTRDTPAGVTSAPGDVTGPGTPLSAEVPAAAQVRHTSPPSLWPLAAGGVGLLAVGALLALRTPHRPSRGAVR